MDACRLRERQAPREVGELGGRGVGGEQIEGAFDLAGLRVERSGTRAQGRGVGHILAGFGTRDESVGGMCRRPVRQRSHHDQGERLGIVGLALQGFVETLQGFARASEIEQQGAGAREGEGGAALVGRRDA